jgi:catechol 2,3-dioxygenase-like lactoylglutathione lyase family enzyme
MIINNIDHLVLTVHDIPRSIKFYTEVLGMTAISFGNDRHALQFNNEKINLHELGHEFEPKAKLPTPGSADLCLISDTPIDDVIVELKQHYIPIELGPIKKNGALGKICSLYLRDPDDNLIEISNYL